MNRASQLKHAILLLTVFLAGVGTLGIEMVIPRLLAPFFGSSQPIWAVIIGATLVYLAIGYRLGGILADRWPYERVLYQLIAWAGLLCSFIPLLSKPLLRMAQQAFSDVVAGGFIAALVGVVLLFALPVILMATVGPFAIRLRMHYAAEGINESGRTAGTISSLSTLGSIIGTFLPVFVLIPTIGTQRTVYLFAAFLVTLGLMGLRDWRFVWMPIVIAVLAYITLTTRDPIKPHACGDRCTSIAEAESLYNYIQVVEEYAPLSRDIQVPYRRNLLLNEGHAIHSTYPLRFRETGDPRDLLTGGPWDYFAVTPYFYPNRNVQSITSLALLGSAAGTIPKQFLAIYGEDIRVDAVEIDPRITETGRAYFDMRDQDIPNYTVYTQDARYWLATTDGTYDVIAMDAYHQPYIPFHLTTVEFFEEARAHLNERGVVVVNAGRPPSGDMRLETALATTMLAVFPQVYVLDSRLPRSASALIVGVNQDVGDGVAHFKDNAAHMQVPALHTVMEWAINEGLYPVRACTHVQTQHMTPFTDDLAPVETLIDALIVDEAKTLMDQDQAGTSYQVYAGDR